MTDMNSRYPNRKRTAGEQGLSRFKVTEAEPKSFSDKLSEADRQDANGEITEEEELLLSGYKIIEPEPKCCDEKPAEPEPRAPLTVSEKAKAKEQNPISELPIFQSLFLEAWMDKSRRFARSPAGVYAAAGAGIAILFGVLIASVFWHMNNPDGPYDLGSVSSGAVGVKGHLWIKWDKSLEYRLKLEAGGPEQQAGFALAVAHPPRPLSIEIHLLDSRGFVLCAKEIVLKYHSGDAASLAASYLDTQTGKTDAAIVSNDQLAQAMNALSEAEEAARELDKDVFQNQIGPDGEIAAINAQGQISCSKKAYENTSSWSFSPIFPSLAEQDELL